MIRRMLTLLSKQTNMASRLTHISRAAGGLHNPKPVDPKVEEKRIDEAVDDAERIATRKVNVAGTKEPVHEQIEIEGQPPKNKAKVVKKATNSLLGSSPVKKKNRENIRLFSSQKKSPKGEEAKEKIDIDKPKESVKEKLEETKEAILDKFEKTKESLKEKIGATQEFVSEKKDLLNQKAKESLDEMQDTKENLKEKSQDIKDIASQKPGGDKNANNPKMDPVFQYDLDLGNKTSKFEREDLKNFNSSHQGQGTVGSTQ